METSKSEVPPLFKIVLKSFKFHHNQPHKICTLAASAHSMLNTAPVDIPLLYEDDFIIIADKPSNILAVPGKGAKPFVKFRHDQWQDAVLLASGGKYGSVDSECRKYLTLLADMSSIPRKEARFYGFIAKTLKISDVPMQKLMWKLINEADISLNKQPFAEIPSHLVSVADLLEKHCGHKIYTVHRLDMETSGVIIFAKTEKSSAELARQFRDREVLQLAKFVPISFVSSITFYYHLSPQKSNQIAKIYYAKVAHRVNVPLQTVRASIRPDLNNRPLQVCFHFLIEFTLTLLSAILGQTVITKYNIMHRLSMLSTVKNRSHIYKS